MSTLIERAYFSPQAYIFKLSEDVLHEILLVAARAVFHDDHELSVENQCWVSVPLVCRYWREVTLASPQFWSFLRVDRHSLGAIRLYLSRSRKAPLYVHFVAPVCTFGARCRYKDFNSVARMIAIHTSRIATFRTSYMSCKTVKGLLSHFTAAAPRLRELSLYGAAYESCTHRPAADDEEFPTVPPFGGNLPLLRTLDARAEFVPLGAYATLTKLRFDTSRALTIDEIAAVLRRCPMLEILHLQISLQLGDVHPSDDIPDLPIQLPRLQELTLTSQQSALRFFLSQMVFPPSIKATIAVRGIWDDNFPLAPALGQSTKNLLDTFKDAEVVVEDHRTTLCSGSRLTITWGMANCDMALTSFKKPLEEVPMPSLESLKFNWATNVLSSGLMSANLSCVPSLRSLHIGQQFIVAHRDSKYPSYSYFFHSLFNALTAPLEDTATTDWGVVCPKMSTLSIACITGKVEEVLDGLFDCLYDRHHIPGTAPLSRLILYSTLDCQAAVQDFDDLMLNMLVKDGVTLENCKCEVERFYDSDVEEA